jgi:hypothetical protein
LASVLDSGKPWPVIKRYKVVITESSFLARP